jgi:hypothetical protein
MRTMVRCHSKSVFKVEALDASIDEGDADL